MSSYRQIIYQIVFGTKYRKQPYQKNTNCTIPVHFGNCRKTQFPLYRINGVSDHIYILSDLHPSISLADYIKNIKVASSLWLKESDLFTQFEGWQDGYGAFTYSIKEKKILIEYVKNPKLHHRSEIFITSIKGC